MPIGSAYSALPGLRSAPWLTAVLSAAVDRFADAASELALAAAALELLLPATDWDSPAARTFHDRVAEAGERLASLRADVAGAEADARQLLARAYAAAWGVP